ncbi:acyltransferase [Leeuwenhoekiella sp. MAR_2009_132]|uniref:acyltransferase n=1 Tax=Leeuwenhoekiella sp. MAR_2009_132 TaxID=1392489 RepID=UPI00048F33F5|nr:acetyltransferase [Leeuwenhoekiella sp. MAR_2009_132]
MAELSFLWKHRSKFSLTSINFYKAWAKRFLTLPALLKRNWRSFKLRQKGASISPTAEIGVIKASGNKKNLSIGANSSIGRVEFALHTKIVVGNNVCINDGVIILTASHNLNDPLWRHKTGDILIKDYAWIATNSILLPGVTIGKGAVVGAGAVVSKSVGDYHIVTGNPAQPISKYRIEDLKYNPCEFLAANQAWLVG